MKDILLFCRKKSEACIKIHHYLKQTATFSGLLLLYGIAGESQGIFHVDPYKNE
jgi:hypothetical protein